MKKKISYLFGTVAGLIALMLSSTTAFACGGEMGYMPPEPNFQATTFQIGKSIITVTSYPIIKAYEGTRIFVDGMEMQILLPK